MVDPGPGAHRGRHPEHLIDSPWALGRQTISAMGEGNRPAGSGRTTVLAAAVGVPVPKAETRRISGTRATLNISRRTWPTVSAVRPMQGSGRDPPAILCARAAGGEAMGTSGSARAAGWPAPLALLAIGLLAAACNSGSGTAAPRMTSPRRGCHDQPPRARHQHDRPRRPAPPPPARPPTYEVKTGTVSGLGTVLVNGQGLTLYMFVPDDQRGRSTCYNACASSWPPLRLPTGVTIPVAAGKAEVSLLGTTTRKDGGLEVTCTTARRSTFG